MFSTGDYPLGAKYDERAPWNEDTTEIPIEVTISMTWSKTLTVKVPKNYDRPDLYNAAQNEVWDDIKKLQEDGWTENEFEVVEE